MARLAHGRQDESSPADLVVGLDGGARLPKPTLDRNRATYANVLPGADLTVQALAQGFTHWLTVKQRPEEPLALRLPLHLSNVTLQMGLAGELRLLDRKGRLRAEAPAPVMWDATTDPASVRASSAPAGRSRAWST